MKSDWTLLEGKYAYDYPRAAIAADCVVFGFDPAESEQMKLKILLVKRKENSRAYPGFWALPGGFLQVSAYETIEECAHRELLQETGLDVDPSKFEQFGVFSLPFRDPDQRVVSVAYYTLLRTCDTCPDTSEDNDVLESGWFSIDQLPYQLAFDHAEILRKARFCLKRDIVSRPMEEGKMPAIERLLPTETTFPNLLRLYECVLGITIDDRSNFFRKMQTIYQPIMVGGKSQSEKGIGHRGGKLYRFDKQAYDAIIRKKKFRIEF